MDDAQVREAVRLIGTGIDGAQAARVVGTPWPTLSSALRDRGISVRGLKRQRDAENIRALVDAGNTVEQIEERLSLPRRAITNLCAAQGLTPENAQDRSRRLKREHVLDLYRSGMEAKAIAQHLGMHLGVVYGVLREREDALPVQVRTLYDQGIPMRVVAQRLGLGLDEARAQLRHATPDARDNDVLTPEARRAANDKQRATRRLRQEAMGTGQEAMGTGA